MKSTSLKEYPTIDYMLRVTWNVVVKAYNTEANKYGFTMVQAFAVLSIDPKRGTSSTLLGPKMGMEPTSLSRTLKNLENLNLIERHPNPEDGRGVIICLTKDGLKMRAISKSVVLEFNEKLEENIGKEKLAAFFEVTQAIQNLISDKKIFKENHEKPTY